MNNSFLMIQYDLLSSNLTSDEKIILSLIKSWNDDNKECFMSNPAIAQLIGLQPKNVSKKINKLKNLGLISITQIYRKNTKQIEKRILKFICYPTPSTIVDTHPQKRDTPSTIVDIPPQKEEDIILDIKLEDKIKDNNITRPVILGEFGNKEKDNYILKNEQKMKYTPEQYQKYFEEYKKQNAYKLNIKIEDEIPTKKNDGFIAKQNVIDLEYKLQNEFYEVDRNILFQAIKDGDENKLPLITKKQLTSTQKELCEKYRELISSTEQSEEII